MDNATEARKGSDQLAFTYESSTPPLSGSTESNILEESEKASSVDETEDSKKIDRTWKELVLFYIQSLIMEPGFLIYMVSSVMGNIMANDLQLDRACRVNMGYNDTICDALMATPKKQGVFVEEEEEVQRVISGIGTWIEVIENFFPILFSLFLGGWTDVYGVKFPFLVAIGGIVVRYIGLLVCVYYSDWTAQTVGMFSILPGSLTGGRIAISMVVYSYVAVTSSLKDRTFRVGVLTAIRTFGRSAGAALGGHLKRSGRDYYFIFGIGGGLGIVSFIYMLLLLPNPRKGSNPFGWDPNSKCEALKNIFDFRSIYASLLAFLKKRPYGIRNQLFLLVIILIFTMAPMQGEDSVLMLFVRKKIGWSTPQYANYSTIRMLIAFGGGLISIGLFVTWMKMKDWKLGALSCFSQIGGCFVYAYAHNALMMHIAPVVDVLNGTMIIAARAMISKIIPIAEIGKVNAIVSVIDATTPLWGNPVYNKVYNQTLDKFTGAFFLLSAALTVPPLLLFIYFGVTKKGIPIEEQAANRERRRLKNVPALKQL